jgi:predicted small integral membrane protein
MAQYSRYLAIFFACLLLLLVGIGAWSHHTAKLRLDSLSVLTYQLKKLDGFSGPLGTVFVGDSSLGNAIDAKTFSELSGSASLNLALTQRYGYVGSWEMMRKALALRPRNVVIMEAVDILKRETERADNRFFSTDASPSATWRDRLFGQLSDPEYLQLIFSAEALKRELIYAIHDRGQPFQWPDDYVPQHGTLEVTPDFVRRNILNPGHNPEKLRFLKEIVTLCEAERVNCIYVHGPLLANLCPASQAYFAEASKAIRDTGIHLLSDTPLCIPPTAIGDSTYHLSTANKQEYTRTYYRMLAPMLR